MIKIIAVGDIMPGGLLSGSDHPCADNNVLDLLRDGDVRCGTLECALGNNPTYDQEKVADRGNVIYAKDEDVKRLKELHINVVSLANNHFFDLGKDGARHTIALLDREGILHCGAGSDLHEAGKPAVIETGGKRIAFIGFCDTVYSHVFWCTYATENSPGVNPLRIDYCLSEIKKYAALYDYVVVMAHWGNEHTFSPNVSTVKMAKKMLKAGACLVLGSHPHRIQPVINTKMGSIAFSMGNFLFPERLIAPPKVTWYPEGEIDYSSLPTTKGYPIVDRITLKSLPFWARVGQIVKTQIGEAGSVSEYRFSFLTASNCLSLLDKNKCEVAQKRISRVGWWIKLGLYQPYFMSKKVSQAILARIKRILK